MSKTEEGGHGDLYVVIWETLNIAPHFVRLSPDGFESELVGPVPDDAYLLSLAEAQRVLQRAKRCVAGLTGEIVTMLPSHDVKPALIRAEWEHRREFGSKTDTTH
jgi:hypothetical protein